MKYFKKTFGRTKKILPLIEDSLNIAQRDINIIKEIFLKKKIPVPEGFTDKDVNEKCTKIVYRCIILLLYLQS